MREAGAAPRDELGDGALVALGVALLLAELILRCQVRIVVHQKFEFAIADIDEDVAEPAQNLRRARMIDRAVFVGDKTFRHMADFDIRLRAVDGAAEIVREDPNGGIVVVGGDPEMVDLVSRAVDARNLQRLDKPRPDTDGLLRFDGNELLAVRSDAFVCDGQAVLGRGRGRVVRLERHVMDTRKTGFFQVGIVRLEECHRRFSNAEERNVAPFERYVAPRQAEGVAEESARRLHVARGQREIIHFISGHAYSPNTLGCADRWRGHASTGSA